MKTTTTTTTTTTITTATTTTTAGNIFNYVFIRQYCSGSEIPSDTYLVNLIFQSIVCGLIGVDGHHVQSPVEEVIKLDGGLLSNMLEMVARNVLEQDFQNDYVIEEDVQQV